MEMEWRAEGDDEVMQIVKVKLRREDWDEIKNRWWDNSQKQKNRNEVKNRRWKWIQT